MWTDPWLPLARFADVLAKLADAAANVYPQAALYELGFRVAALMLRHPAFLPGVAQTAHHFPYWR
jgi:hypothetical protein